MAARISNIDASTTAEELLAYLESKTLLLSVDHGEIFFSTTDGGNKRTTVTFLDQGTLQRSLSLPRLDRKLKNRTLNFDEDFDGFTVLTGNNEIQVDIVALHGMNGHAFNSWVYHDGSGFSFMWLRDYLPERIPNAQVMVYGYNANIISDVSEGRIRSYADTFLERLLQVRKRNPVVDRPLILIGHSLGGLVIKQALIIANSRADGRFETVLNSVAGVAFLGTPHRGMNRVNTTTFISNFVGASTGNVAVRDDLIEEQHSGSAVLFDLTDDFKQLIAARNIDIATLFEVKKTECGGSDDPIWIVDEQSATLGVAGERKASIEADHINLCKFKDVNDPSLTFTVDFITEFCNDAVLVHAEAHHQQHSNLSPPPAYTPH